MLCFVYVVLWRCCCFCASIKCVEMQPFCLAIGTPHTLFGCCFCDIFFYGFSVATIHVAHAYSLCIYFFLNLLLALLNEFLRPTHKHTRARATQRQRVNHGFYEIFQPHRRTSYTFNVFFWTQERNMNIINLPSLYVKRNRCHVC